MEKTDAAAVVPMDPGWNDVGSWASLWDIADKDEDRNVLIGDVITIGTTGSYVKAPHRLVATVGLDGIVVIDTKDAVLIARKDSVQDVKAVVDRLNEQRRPEAIDNQAAESVPGVAVVLDTGSHHTVSRVSIDAGHSAHFAADSNQHQMLHVVRGTVQVSSSDPTRLLVVGDSETLPPNESIELENRGTDAVEVVSVTFHSSGDDETTIT